MFVNFMSKVLTQTKFFIFKSHMVFAVMVIGVAFCHESHAVYQKAIVDCNEFIRITKNESSNFEFFFKSINGYIDASTHPILDYYKNDNFKEQLAVYITSEILKFKNAEQYVSTLKNIILNHDFRIINDYFRSIEGNDKKLQQKIENLNAISYKNIDYDKLKMNKTLNNKINFYLTKTVNEKITKIFIKSKKHDLSRETTSIFHGILEAVENELIFDALRSSRSGKALARNKNNGNAIKMLKELINALYVTDNKKEFSSLIKSFNKELNFFTNKQVSTSNRPAIYRNYTSVKNEVERLLIERWKAYNPYLFMVAGSFSRKEITYGSDLEIFIFGEEPSKIEHILQNDFKNNLKMDVDMYAVTDLTKIEQFLTELPDYFIDFQIAKKYAGDNQYLEIYNGITNKIFSKPGFIAEVFRKRTVAHINSEVYKSGSHAQIKEILNMWNTLESLGNYLNCGSILKKSNHIKQRLLHYKNEFEFNKYYGVKEPLCINEFFLKNVVNLLKTAYEETGEHLERSGHNKIQYQLSTTINEKKKNQEIDFKTITSFRWMQNNPYDLENKKGEKYLMKSIRPSYETIIDSGIGATFYNSDGNDIIDFSSMTVNCILGQNDPWVKLNQVSYILSDKPSFHSSKFGSEIYYEIPKLLVDSKIGGMIDPQLNHKQCNGSDVVELAIKAAFANRGKRKNIVSFAGSYHGQNLTAYIISDKQKHHRFLEVNNENIIFLDAPPNKKVWTTPEVFEERALSISEEKIVKDLENVAKNTYAIILEPIQGNNDLNMFSLPLMRKIKEISIQNDICLIFDEIQTGFGWLGKMTAAEVYGVSPDILLLGKALTAGNGPLSIAIFSGKYKDSLGYGSAEKTNGADLSSLVAVKAVFERLNGVRDHKEIPNSFNEKLRNELKEGLLNGYSKKVKLLEANLTNLLCDHNKVINEKVGMGLIRGLRVKSIGNLTSTEVAKEIVQMGVLRGILLRQSGDILIIKLPLVTSENELFLGFRRLNEILNILEKKYTNA